MGIFNFLKKPKAEKAEAGMELPPVPKIEGTEGFPEIKKEEAPPLPETSLPPLPTEIPGAVPPKPEEEKLEAPKIEIPEPPEMGKVEPEKIETKEKVEEIKPEKALPKPPEMEKVELEKEASPAPEKPEFPEMPSEEIVPEKIPPLEELPEPPAFKPEAAEKVIETPAPQPSMHIEVEEHPTYAAPEEEAVPKRRIRGPLFIRADRFRAVIDDIEQVRSKFKEEDDIFFRMTDVKNAQDQKFEDFRQALEDVQRKLLFIDRSLFETK